MTPVLPCYLSNDCCEFVKIKIHDSRALSLYAANCLSLLLHEKETKVLPNLISRADIFDDARRRLSIREKNARYSEKQSTFMSQAKVVQECDDYRRCPRPLLRALRKVARPSRWLFRFSLSRRRCSRDNRSRGNPHLISPRLISLETSPVTVGAIETLASRRFSIARRTTSGPGRGMTLCRWRRWHTFSEDAEDSAAADGRARNAIRRAEPFAKYPESHIVASASLSPRLL